MMKTKAMLNTKSIPLFLVLAAAGSSTRMGTGSKKEYFTLHGGTVLSEAARVFLNAATFTGIVITIPVGGESDAKTALFADKTIEHFFVNTKFFFIEGGTTRQQSVYKALSFLRTTFSEYKKGFVLIHDAARPFVSSEIIKNVITTGLQFGAAVPVVPPVDTQKEIASDGTIKRHLIRSELCAVQTPQGFFLEPLCQCHELASKQDKEYTDDTEIWDSFPECTGGKKVHVVTGEVKNKKITYAADLPQNTTGTRNSTTMIHTGFGTDLHKLVEGRKLILGGVVIPFEKGELGHSDGDVLLHAVTDALLGASGLGDIGSYFPPEDPQWKDADSALLLKKVWNDIKDEGWRLCNLDCVIEIERPKFIPYRSEVIKSIASILQIDETQVFVKAKTNEKLEAVGAGEAVKAYCSCLLEK